MASAAARRHERPSYSLALTTASQYPTPATRPVTMIFLAPLCAWMSILVGRSSAPIWLSFQPGCVELLCPTHSFFFLVISLSSLDKVSSLLRRYLVLLSKLGMCTESVIGSKAFVPDRP